eukprot:TRINITY_DN924_c0_g2_i1.p1 TRINITY_DN924_c0_g2~~TRINITY_DN924_c0_g2_i1.p1  ORF type:complete len:551 (+),score=52.94 TRINITY_DN924_c0_g2_i1:278-1930(+)
MDDKQYMAKWENDSTCVENLELWRVEFGTPKRVSASTTVLKQLEPQFLSVLDPFSAVSDITGSELSAMEKRFQLRMFEDIASYSQILNERSLYSKVGRFFTDYFDCCRLETRNPADWATASDCRDDAVAFEHVLQPDQFVKFTERTRFMVEWEITNSAAEMSLQLLNHKNRFQLWAMMARQADDDWAHSFDGNVADVYGALCTYTTARDRCGVQFFVMSTTVECRHQLCLFGPLHRLGRTQQSMPHLMLAVSGITATLHAIFADVAVVRRYSAEYHIPEDKRPIPGPAPDVVKLTRTTQLLQAQDTAAAAQQVIARIKGSASSVLVGMQSVFSRNKTRVFQGLLTTTEVPAVLVAKVTDRADPPTNEITALTKLQGDGVVVLVQHMISRHGYGLVLAFVDTAKPNFDLLGTRKRSEAAFLCGGLVAIVRSHSARIAHGDIRIGNFGLDAGTFFRLMDFGACFPVGRHQLDQPNEHFGVPCVETDGSYDETIDVWMFGDVFLRALVDDAVFGPVCANSHEGIRAFHNLHSCRILFEKRAEVSGRVRYQERV